MADERERAEWWHTASLLAAVRNSLMISGDPISPADLHPMEKKAPRIIHCGKDLSLMRQILCPSVPPAPKKKKIL